MEVIKKRSSSSKNYCKYERTEVERAGVKNTKKVGHGFDLCVRI